ncbi:hypothetical protein FB451DRAFT_722497 [Mycena latifolia]|nr:hypothetical protein FB451DRAFT_722497 [Mycena latifolia]
MRLPVPGALGRRIQGWVPQARGTKASTQGGVRRCPHQRKLWRKKCRRPRRGCSIRLARRPSGPMIRIPRNRPRRRPHALVSDYPAGCVRRWALLALYLRQPPLSRSWSSSVCCGLARPVVPRRTAPSPPSSPCSQRTPPRVRGARAPLVLLVIRLHFLFAVSTHNAHLVGTNTANGSAPACCRSHRTCTRT